MKSKVIIVPVPYEKTTSYGKGTKNGPAAILSAFKQVEQYDIELDKRTDKILIKILPAVKDIKKISYDNSDYKLPIYLGGEHTITTAIISAIKTKRRDFSILHLDAHSDLRDTYQGKKYSHACVMRRVWEMGVPFVSVGVRSQSYEEREFIKKHHIRMFYAHQIYKDKNWIKKVINNLSKNIYISFDVDVFDPGAVRATGTPEPGGLSWQQVVDLFKAIKDASKHLIGMDIVELAPQKYDLASSFTCAALLHKTLAIFC